MASGEVAVDKGAGSGLACAGDGQGVGMRRFLRMGAAVATLCWGGGVAAQTAPVPIDPADWITHDDYPVAALQQGLSGTVEVAFAVDPTGRTTGCSITKSSGSAILDDAACNAMLPRARFEPAKDAGGKAVAGTSPRRVRWSLPSTVASATPVRSFALIEHLTFDAAGKIVGCTGRAAGEIGGELPVCLRAGDSLVASQFMTGRYRNGVATRLVTQSVADDPMPPDVPGSDLPPHWTVERTFTLLPDGMVADCAQRESGKGIVPCETRGNYASPSDGRPHRVAFETRWAFQPNK